MNPLFGSVFQALTTGQLSVTERFRIDGEGINPRAPDALDPATLASLGLPLYGTVHPLNDLIQVTDIGVERSGPDSVTYTYRYTAPEFAPQQSSSNERARVGTVSFDVLTEKDAVSVPQLSFVPSVATVVDDSNNETDLYTPNWSISYRDVSINFARILFTVNGTASDLGISNSVGSVGLAPAVLAQANQIHIIGGMALKFEGVDVSWNTSDGNDRIYTFRYEWVYEEGIKVDGAQSYPDEFEPNPVFGTFADGFEQVLEGYGKITAEPDTGDLLYGLALPHVMAPAPLRGVGHVGALHRFLVPPYCDVSVTLRKGDILAPTFVVNPQYRKIDSDSIWQQFPGVG